MRDRLATLFIAFVVVMIVRALAGYRTGIDIVSWLAIFFAIFVMHWRGTH